MCHKPHISQAFFACHLDLMPGSSAAASKAAPSLTSRQVAAAVRSQSGAPAKKQRRAARIPSASERCAQASGSRPGLGAGSVACGACNCRPGPSHAWFSYAPGPGKVAVGDRCMDCETVRSAAFGHMEWEAYASHVQSEQGQVDLKQARETESGEKRLWVPESAHSLQGTRYVLQRSCLIMSPAEYKKEFGKPGPGSRGPRVPMVTLPSESADGGDMEYYAFFDPANPFRRLLIQQEIGDFRQGHSLDQSDNRYEAQASQVHQECRAHTSARVAVSSLLSPQAQLPEIDDHLSKVNPSLYAERQSMVSAGCDEVNAPTHAPRDGSDEGPAAKGSFLETPTRQQRISRGGSIASLGASPSPDASRVATTNCSRVDRHGWRHGP